MQKKPLILNFAPTGLVAGREQSPHVPLSPEEIITEVRSAVATGITVVHLHARDSRNLSTSDPEMYARIIGGIREFAPELVICVSLTGRRVGNLEERCAPLKLTGDVKPDMASLTLSSLNFSREASVNAPDTVLEIARRLLDCGVLPELEIFDLGMTQAMRYLIHKGLLHPPYYANLVMGGPFIAQASLLHLSALVSSLPPDTHWSAGGIGGAQLPANGLAIASGGGVRVGLEDNLCYDHDSRQLATNSALLNRVHQLASLHERPVMTPVEFRALFNLQPGGGSFGCHQKIP
ncbi:MAG: 3-keto-5-aminohexanoate cleavage protein [Verrucomicrobiota bacterium]